MQLTITNPFTHEQTEAEVHAQGLGWDVTGLEFQPRLLSCALPRCAAPWPNWLRFPQVQMKLILPASFCSQDSCTYLCAFILSHSKLDSRKLWEINKWIPIKVFWRLWWERKNKPTLTVSLYVPDTMPASAHLLSNLILTKNANLPFLNVLWGQLDLARILVAFHRAGSI